MKFFCGTTARAAAQGFGRSECSCQWSVPAGSVTLSDAAGSENQCRALDRSGSVPAPAASISESGGCVQTSSRGRGDVPQGLVFLLAAGSDPGTAHRAAGIQSQGQSQQAAIGAQLLGRKPRESGTSPRSHESGNSMRPANPSGTFHNELQSKLKREPLEVSPCMPNATFFAQDLGVSNEVRDVPFRQIGSGIS